jgi:hypothetical protein
MHVILLLTRTVVRKQQQGKAGREGGMGDGEGNADFVHCYEATWNGD